MYLNPELPPWDGIKRMDDRLLPSPHITGKELQAEFPHRTQRKAAHKRIWCPQNTNSGPTIFSFMMAWCHTNKNGQSDWETERRLCLPAQHPVSGPFPVQNTRICGQDHDGRIPPQEIHRRLTAVLHQRPIRSQCRAATEVEIPHLSGFIIVDAAISRGSLFVFLGS